jgi:hypothetical protein
MVMLAIPARGGSPTSCAKSDEFSVMKLSLRQIGVRKPTHKLTQNRGSSYVTGVIRIEEQVHHACIS